MYFAHKLSDDRWLSAWKSSQKYSSICERFSDDTMTTQYPNASKTERELFLSFPQEFKEHLEDLVFGILKEKPSDPLEYAFNFFSKKLKTREGRY